MRTLPVLVALLATASALAGCSGGSDPSTSTTQELAAGKGGISGLVIDDRYRPIPGAVVLLLPLGLQATADVQGQVVFNDLEPASYQLKVTAAGHEAAPTPVDVTAGEYSEVELQARRVFSEDGRIVTTEYSVFIPCAVDFFVDGYVLDCTGDQSGDTFRAGFISDYTAYAGNATFLVTEMLANKEDRYEVQVREDDGSSSGGARFAVAQFSGSYLKIQFEVGKANEEYNGQANNVPFNVTKKINTILFSDSQFREELQGADPLGLICCGAGAHLGIKAKFLQSLFLGKPEVDLSSYGVLKPAS